MMHSRMKTMRPGARFLALVVMAVVLLFSGMAQADNHGGGQPDMVMVTPSPHSFPETLAAFEREASEAGWSILHRNNMAGTLSERGFTIDPVVILDVCSGRYSAQILEEDAYRPVSAFMPCRVSIYQDSQGDVFISRMNVPGFLPMMPEGVAEVMEKSSEEIEAIIERTVAE